MRNNILSIVLLLFLLNGCNKKENELEPTNKFSSWLEIKDEPGEVNQLWSFIVFHGYDRV